MVNGPKWTVLPDKLQQRRSSTLSLNHLFSTATVLLAAQIDIAKLITNCEVSSISLEDLHKSHANVFSRKVDLATQSVNATV